MSLTPPSGLQLLRERFNNYTKQRAAASQDDSDREQKSNQDNQKEIKEKVEAANEKARKRRAEAEKQCQTILSGVAVGPWTEEMKAQFLKFTSYVTALIGEAKWTLSVQEIMSAPEYVALGPFFKAQAVAWYDAYLRTQLRHQTISVLVTSAQSATTAGFFMLVDNRGSIIYPSPVVLDSLCNLGDHRSHPILGQHLVCGYDVDPFHPLIEFDFAPELKLESCKLCFVSFDMSGLHKKQNLSFFHILSALPNAFNQFLTAKRDSPADVTTAFESLKAALALDRLRVGGNIAIAMNRLKSTSWSTLVKNGGEIIVDLLRKLAEHKRAHLVGFDWEQRMTGDGKENGEVTKLHQEFEFRIHLDADA